MAGSRDLRATANENATKAPRIAGQPSNKTHQPGPNSNPVAISPYIDEPQKRWMVSLSDDSQSHVGNYVENQKEDLEQPEKRVHDKVVGLSGNGKPFALRAVHQIRGQDKHYGPEDQQGSIHDRAPHEKIRQCLKIHDVPFLSVCIQRVCRHLDPGWF
jgi:hypothetical protein